uniref:Coiled-coil domain-containing protein 81 n=1 Tax=Gongylonema pulchrum TaxID=637853 RepID=A0A183F0B1_9BILA
LMYAKHEKIPMKDFGSEIRATMDIDHLLNKSVLLLDLQETSLEEIFAKCVDFFFLTKSHIGKRPGASVMLIGLQLCDYIRSFETNKH